MSTPPNDLYASLGVSPHATAAQLRQAYRALLRRHHPDTRSVGPTGASHAADVALQQVLAAYEVLGDPARRAEYDRARTVSVSSPIPVKVRIHRTGATTSDPPIQSGPVLWQRPTA